MKSPPTLDPLLHQPVRTRVVGLILTNQEISFSELKRSLQVTDGNLDAHLRKLTAAGYLHSRLVCADRPYTLYSLSRSGQKAVSAYLRNLHTLLPRTR